MAKLIKVDDIKWQSTQNGGWERPYEYVTKQDIDRMPAVEVVHGRWIKLPSMAPEYACSECGQSYEWWEVSEAHYCPNCGKTMDLESDRIKVLVACEESQAVTTELRRLGHEAYSCDIIECSGGHPEWHIMQDVLPLLNGDCEFMSMDGQTHTIKGKWDMIIAFPPCTDLAVSGARYFKEKQEDGRQQRSIEFFMAFVNADCPRIAIENPIGIMSTKHRKPDQIIQPWQFGHGETKATCLWLKGLPLLKPTEVVKGREQRIWKMPPSKDRARERSKTYPGIAKAMAEQWAGGHGKRQTGR